jgi:hypothetical protein
MARPTITIRSLNTPDVGVVAKAAVALILDFHAKNSCHLLQIVQGSQRNIDSSTASRVARPGKSAETDSNE